MTCALLLAIVHIFPAVVLAYMCSGAAMESLSSTAVLVPPDKICSIEDSGLPDVSQDICTTDATQFYYADVSALSVWISDEGTFTCQGTVITGSCAFNSFTDVHNYCSGESSCIGWAKDTTINKYYATRSTVFTSSYANPSLAIRKRYCPILTITNPQLTSIADALHISWTQSFDDAGGFLCLASTMPDDAMNCIDFKAHGFLSNTDNNFVNEMTLSVQSTYYIYYCYGPGIGFSLCTSRYGIELLPADFGAACANDGHCVMASHGTSSCSNSQCELTCDASYTFSTGGGAGGAGSTCVAVPATSVQTTLAIESTSSGPIVIPTSTQVSTDDGNLNLNQNNGVNGQSSTTATQYTSTAIPTTRAIPTTIAIPTTTAAPEQYVFSHDSVSQSDLSTLQNALALGALDALHINIPDAQNLFDSMFQWKSDNISATGQFTVHSATVEPGSDTIVFLVFSSDALTIGDCVGSNTFNDISNSHLATSTYGQGGTLAFHVPTNVQNVYYIVDLSVSNTNVNRKRRRVASNRILALQLYSGSTYLGIAKFPYELHDPTQTTIEFSMIQGYFHGTPKKAVVHMNCKDISPSDVQDNGQYQELWSKYKASLSTDGSDGGNNEFEGAVDALAEEYLFQAFQRYLKRMKYCRDTHPGPFGNGDNGKKKKKRYVR
ncbi:UNVERIFIED_CONTAM: hypothetical protein HDU68_005016 [Siphonaria sp. JEL0065]|nr:hypothetical protein HDU68_005016 [Siphonaria sp. JEL0065]